MSTDDDPRPLTGEPLPLDLLNTRWTDDDGTEHDLLGRPGGLGIWLATNGLRVPETQETLDALLETREALFELVQPEVRDPVRSRALLNETLRHGHFRRRLGANGPENVLETDTPGWQAAWRAAEGYLLLLERDPGRIRKCANPECRLRFYDVSKAGARRWCSMAACGNRAKYARHRDSR
ncbi:CGNR zinc finger domain-containing protein [Paractinoplanes atraurantiacus]|nr:CGNR zinc finger domain-containing protein [Actinoplanes atraurantiacus]